MEDDLIIPEIPICIDQPIKKKKTPFYHATQNASKQNFIQIKIITVYYSPQDGSIKSCNLRGVTFWLQVVVFTEGKRLPQDRREWAVKVRWRGKYTLNFEIQKTTKDEKPFESCSSTCNNPSVGYFFQSLKGWHVYEPLRLPQMPPSSAVMLGNLPRAFTGRGHLKNTFVFQSSTQKIMSSQMLTNIQI